MTGQVYNKQGKLLMSFPTSVAVRNYIKRLGLKKGSYDIVWVIKSSK